jgi:hypothetical protein
VRVTIEGEAYHPSGDDRTLIVVRQDGGKIVFPSSAEGVTVENIEPPRVWTDGDVVQEVDTDRVWRRVRNEAGSRWTNGLLAFRQDATVNTELSAGRVRVLRYQAGDL